MPAKGYRKPNKKDKRFEMRLSEEEHKKLMEYAERYNESAAEFLLKFLRNTLFDDSSTNAPTHSGV